MEYNSEAHTPIFVVGYKTGNDFDGLKGFDNRDDAFEFYVKELAERGYLYTGRKLVIRDTKEKVDYFIDTTLKIEDYD